MVCFADVWSQNNGESLENKGHKANRTVKNRLQYNTFHSSHTLVRAHGQNGEDKNARNTW